MGVGPRAAAVCLALAWASGAAALSRLEPGSPPDGASRLRARAPLAVDSRARSPPPPSWRGVGDSIAAGFGEGEGARRPDAVSWSLSATEPEAVSGATARLVSLARGAGAARLWARSFFAQPPANASGNASGNAAAEVKEEASPEETGNLLGFDVSRLRMAQFGSLLWLMCIVAAIGMCAFEAYHYRCAGTDLSKAIDFGGETHESRISRMLHGVWPLISPYLFQKGSSRQWYFVVALVALGLWSMLLGIILLVWMKEFWDIMEHKKLERFFPIMKDFTLLLATMILVGTYQSYIGMMFVIDWRRWMTKWLLGEWLEDKTYYRMQLARNADNPDNPDQRLQEDINIFIPTVVSLTTGFAEAVGQLLINLPILLFLSPTTAFGTFYCPGWLLYLALLYSGLGTLVAHWIGSRLIFVNFAKQKYEADFRYHVVQVRDHAESIALYGAEECERLQLEGRFDAIVRVWWMLMLYSKRLGFFTAFYMQTSHTFPYLVLAPSYFKGQITMGTLFLLFRALGNVKGAFDWIITSYSVLTDFRATADRLHNFRIAIEQHKGGSQVRQCNTAAPSSPEAALVAEGICVTLPASGGAREIWKNAGLTVRQGEFVLLTAPEGSGKSCFFRALAGIWPDSTGVVHMRGSVLFVPQRSHIPQGTLKQALAYPDSEDHFTDEQVKMALSAVALDKALGDRGLADEANWEIILSGGEQQRLAVAHAVLRRPSVLFLDEATSAMGDEGALELYSLLRRPGTLPEGAAVVSISHSVNLLEPVHDTRYTYSPEGGRWAPG